MREREKRRAEYRTWKKGYYHLCTDGKKSVLCYDDAEYAHLVNVIAVLDQKFPVKVHFYEVMRRMSISFFPDAGVIAWRLSIT